MNIIGDIFTVILLVSDLLSVAPKIPAGNLDQKTEVVAPASVTKVSLDSQSLLKKEI